MSNLLRKTTQYVHLFWDAFANPEGIAVDATCGNGNDSLYLCRKFRKVYCFDIQQTAIENTGKLLAENGLDNYRLIHDSNACIDRYIDGKADLIVYNLGYLPKGDKNITTTAESTVESIKKSLELLSDQGLISITVYWGHPQGKKEKEAVLELAQGLDSSLYQVIHITSINQDNCPPEVVLISRKRYKE